MKWIVMCVLLCSIDAFSQTNYVLYGTNGAVQKVSSAMSYVEDKDILKMGEEMLSGVNWSNVVLGSFVGPVPENLSNTNQLPSIVKIRPLTEEELQLAKPKPLKVLENQFLMFCDQVSGATNHVKLSIPQLNEIGEGIEDPIVKMNLVVQLLTIDAQGKTYNGLGWWDTCSWHPEVLSGMKKMKKFLKKGDKLVYDVE